MVYPVTMVIVSASLHIAISRLNSIPLVTFATAANKDNQMLHLHQRRPLRLSHFVPLTAAYILPHYEAMLEGLLV